MMTFDPNRCGSSPGSADTCGDAIQAIEPKSATHSIDAAARQLIPAYLESDQAALVDFVRQHLSFLRATSLNRMINAIKRPQNQLFNRLYPEILNIEDGSYICLSNDLLAKGKSQGQIEFAISRQTPPSYIGPPPLERITNQGQVVLTYEYDPDRNERDLLEQQIRWSIAGTDKRCRLDVLYDALCGFRDFRQLEVVWSGNKSCHIHVLVDSRHLARSRFGGEIEIRPVRIRKSQTGSYCVPG